MKPIERFLKNFDEQFKKAKFKNIKPDKSNLNKIYKNNISIWYYLNSDKVEKKDGTKEINSKLDTINQVILKNPENFVFCKTKDGFSLTESDFINSELSIIDTIENFSISEKKQFDIYRKHLIDKLEQLEENSKNKSFIGKRVQNLFNFIDFLHSNIDNFKSYDNIIQNLYSLDKQRNALKPENNFKEKLKYDEVQNELEQKFKIIDNNIIQKIKEKTIKFDIFEWNDTDTIWHNHISDIRKLKKNFTSSDVQLIIKQKEKYLQFRKRTNEVYFCKNFFTYLDRTLKELFDYFNESNINEFESFESKPLKLNNMNDLIQVLKSKVDFGELEYNDNEIKIDKKPLQKEIEKPDKVKNKHPKHEPNLWSSECYKLFKYLFDNYFDNKTKRQLTNIWFYLNEYDQVKYNFKATKDKYKDFIKKNYNIKITNFEKAQVKYHTEYGTMNEHRINYEDNF
jgi:hypothetical protein